jgi:hypothetical protein
MSWNPFNWWIYTETRDLIVRFLRSTRPPPETFREGQRSLMVKLMSGAGIFCGGLAIWLVLVIKDQSWPETLRGQQLELIGWALIGAFVGMTLVILALMIGGPVGKGQAKVEGPGGTKMDLSLEGDDEPSPSVVTTTTTEVKP